MTMTQRLVFFKIALITLATQVGLDAAKAPDNLAGFVKFPPPKTFTEKVMNVARVVQPGQQTEMLPMFLLGGFGYPNYPGVSETHNVTVFFFESADKPMGSYVVLGKISKDSPLRSTVQSLQWAVEDRGDWVLMAKNAEALKAVTDVDALVAINNEKAEFDIEARILLGKENVDLWMTDLKQTVTNRHAAATGGQHDAIDVYNKTRFIDFAQEAAQNFDWAELGINLSAEAITFGYLIQATTGTPEATLLSSKAGGKVPVAGLMSAQGMMLYQGAFSVPALLAYNDVLVSRAEALVGEKGKAWLADYKRQLKDYMGMADGMYVGAAKTISETPEFESITGGKFTDKKTVAAAKAFYEKLLPEFFNGIPYFANYGMDYTFSFKENVGQAHGVPVHEVTTTVTVESPVSVQAAGQKVPQPQTQTQSYLFAVADGQLITTNSLASIKPLVAQVKAGKPVENNIAEQFKPTDGAAMQYRINLMEYMNFGLQTAVQGGAPDMEAYAKLVDKLAKEDLPTSTGEIMVGDNRMKGTLSLPVATLAKVARSLQKLQAEMALQEQQQAQPSSEDTTAE